jgi:hypothetical protein
MMAQRGIDWQFAVCLTLAAIRVARRRARDRLRLLAVESNCDHCRADLRMIFSKILAIPARTSAAFTGAIGQWAGPRIHGRADRFRRRGFSAANRRVQDMSLRMIALGAGLVVAVGLYGASSASAVPANGVVLGEAAAATVATQQVWWRRWHWHRRWHWYRRW